MTDVRISYPQNVFGGSAPNQHTVRVRARPNVGWGNRRPMLQCRPRVRQAPSVLGPSVALANAAFPHAEALHVCGLAITCGLVIIVYQGVPVWFPIVPRRTPIGPVPHSRLGRVNFGRVQVWAGAAVQVWAGAGWARAGLGGSRFGRVTGCAMGQCQGRFGRVQVCRKGCTPGNSTSMSGAAGSCVGGLVDGPSLLPAVGRLGSSCYPGAAAAAGTAGAAAGGSGSGCGASSAGIL